MAQRGEVVGREIPEMGTKWGRDFSRAGCNTVAETLVAVGGTSGVVVAGCGPISGKSGRDVPRGTLAAAAKRRLPVKFGDCSFLTMERPRTHGGRPSSTPLT